MNKISIFAFNFFRQQPMGLGGGFDKHIIKTPWPNRPLKKLKTGSYTERGLARSFVLDAPGRILFVVQATERQSSRSQLRSKEEHAF